MHSSMNTNECSQLPNPKRLKTLACSVGDTKGNNLLHKFVLDNSEPNKSGSASYINAVLLSMSDISADTVNALNEEGYNALHLAALKNNLLMVNKLLSCLVNIDINARIDYLNKGYTALHLAAESGHVPIVQELLNKGADVNIKGDGFTPLCVAIRESENLEAIKLLVSRGAEVNPEISISPLFEAAHLGNFAAVEFLVKNGADVNSKYGVHRQPIYGAINACNLELVEYLTKNGADINKYGKGLVYKAACRGQLNIIKFLLDRGANVDIKGEDGYELLKNAVSSGDFETVEFFVRSGAGINNIDEKDKTPLHNAARLSNSVRVVKFLIDNGADVNSTTRNGETPLHDAIRYKNLETAEFLIKSGSDANATNEENETPLHLAAMEGHIDIIKMLLERVVNININSKGKNSKIPLHCAVQYGFLGCAELLINRGADLHAMDANGRTPLHYAGILNHVKSAELLINKGACLNVLDNDGETPLLIAVSKNSVDCVDLFLKLRANLNAKYKNGDTLLHEAVLTGSVRLINILIEKGIDVNAKNEGNGFTSLHLLVDRMQYRQLKRKRDFKRRNDNDLAKIKLLLEAHADVNIPDDRNETPLCRVIRYRNDDLIRLFAEYTSDFKNLNDECGNALLSSLVRSDSYDTLKLLLEKDTDVSVKNIITRNPGLLYCAVKCGNSEITKLLLDNGVDLKAKYVQGDTILHIACDYNYRLDILEMLIERGCDWNAKNEVDETPLVVAALNSNLDYTRLLLERGASVNAADIDGGTPLHFAASKGNLEIVRLLLDRGADLNAKNKDGKTPLDVSKENKHQSCVDVLQEPDNI